MQISLRLFECHDCGHKMRLSGTRCGRCFTPKPYWQVAAYRGALAGLGLLVLLVLYLVVVLT